MSRLQAGHAFLTPLLAAAFFSLHELAMTHARPLGIAVGHRYGLQLALSPLVTQGLSHAPYVFLRVKPPPRLRNKVPRGERQRPAACKSGQPAPPA